MRCRAALRDAEQLTFIIGGARSGKSAHAEHLATLSPGPWTYIATAQAFDEEMRTRIGEHRARRREGWETVDSPHHLTDALGSVPEGRPVLVDCLTLWLTNRMLAGADVESEGKSLALALAAPRGPWFVVSNEVGLGIVPENPLARRFRDAQGKLNQQVAAGADRVILMVAGLAMTVK